MSSLSIPVDISAFTKAAQAASSILVALKECDPELRCEAENLLSQLAEGSLDQHEVFATCALLAEILYPCADHKGLPGLDLEEAETIAPSVNPEAASVLDRMDREESHFAERLRALMQEKGLTQTELAIKAGIGQPAVSMLLNRACRPQRKTVLRFADALGVPPETLWPALKSE